MFVHISSEGESYFRNFVENIKGEFCKLIVAAEIIVYPHDLIPVSNC